MVEYATTRLMSVCVRAMVAPSTIVMAPTTATTDIAGGDALYNGASLATMKTPAVTIVAAWMRAEIGVGPSIASGSHTWSGNCADFPTAPMKSRRQITVMVETSKLPPTGSRMFITFAVAGPTLAKAVA